MLTDERIKQLASKWASKYTHRSAPLESVFSFMDRNLVDFGKSIESEVRKEQADKIAELTTQLAEARKDSERYRWLRFSLSDRVSGKSHWFCSIPEGQPDALDKEIDVAIKAKEQP